MSLDQTSDEQLWARVLAEDEKAFEQVVTKYQSAVSAIAYNRTLDFAISRDIAQETFMGGGAMAQSANTPEARSVIQNETYAWVIDWLQRNNRVFIVCISLINCVSPSLGWLMQKCLYVRRHA